MNDSDQSAFFPPGIEKAALLKGMVQVVAVLASYHLELGRQGIPEPVRSELVLDLARGVWRQSTQQHPPAAKEDGA